MPFSKKGQLKSGCSTSHPSDFLSDQGEISQLLWAPSASAHQASASVPAISVGLCWSPALCNVLLAKGSPVLDTAGQMWAQEKNKPVLLQPDPFQFASYTAAGEGTQSLPGSAFTLTAQELCLHLLWQVTLRFLAAEAVSFPVLQFFRS